MIRSMTLGCAVLALFALACGGGSDSGTGDTAAPGAPAAQEKADDVAAPAPAASSGGPVEQCRTLADKKQWAQALEPCTQAAQQKPEDLAIQHALQQAQAAANQ